MTQLEDLTERFTSTLNSHFDADSHTWKCPGKSFHMAKKDIWGHLGEERIQLCFMIFNLIFLMTLVSSRRVRYNFAHVKPHASNLLFVGLLCGIGTNPSQVGLYILGFCEQINQNKTKHNCRYSYSRIITLRPIKSLFWH